MRICLPRLNQITVPYRSRCHFPFKTRSPRRCRCLFPSHSPYHRTVPFSLPFSLPVSASPYRIVSLPFPPAKLDHRAVLVALFHASLRITVPYRSRRPFPCQSPLHRAVPYRIVSLSFSSAKLDHRAVPLSLPFPCKARSPYRIVALFPAGLRFTGLTQSKTNDAHARKRRKCRRPASSTLCSAISSNKASNREVNLDINGGRHTRDSNIVELPLYNAGTSKYEDQDFKERFGPFS